VVSFSEFLYHDVVAVCYVLLLVTLLLVSVFQHYYFVLMQGVRCSVRC